MGSPERELGAGSGAQLLYRALGLSWTQTNSVSSALHGPVAHGGPFLPAPGPGVHKFSKRCSQAGKLSGVGRGHTGQSDYRPDPSPEPMPWCDEISTAKGSPQGWTQRPGGWPRGFGSDSVCAQALLVTGQRAPTVGLVRGVTGNVLKTTKPSGRESMCAQYLSLLAGRLDLGHR